MYICICIYVYLYMCIFVYMYTPLILAPRAQNSSPGTAFGLLSLDFGCDASMAKRRGNPRFRACCVPSVLSGREVSQDFSVV